MADEGAVTTTTPVTLVAASLLLMLEGGLVVLLMMFLLVLVVLGGASFSPANPVGLLLAGLFVGVPAMAFISGLALLRGRAWGRWAGLLSQVAVLAFVVVGAFTIQATPHTGGVDRDLLPYLAVLALGVMGLLMLPSTGKALRSSRTDG